MTRKPRRWLPMVAFAAFCSIVLFVIYAHLSIVAHDWGLIPRNFLRRSVQDKSENAGKFDWKIWLQVAAMGRNVANHTAVVLLLAMAWCAGRIWKRFHAGFGGIPTTRMGDLPEVEPGRRYTSEPGVVVIILLGWGILHVLVGRQGTFVHDWWWWPLTPGVTMAAALAIDGTLKTYELKRPASAPFARWLMTVAVSVFVIVTAIRTIRPFHQPGDIYGHMLEGAGPLYTTADLGSAIQAVAKPNEAVVLAENDDEPSVWYYANRPLIMGVWDSAALNRALHRGKADLVFGATQAWTPPPVAFVVPRQYDFAVGPLLKYLRGNYREVGLPSTLAGQFRAFRLDERAGSVD